MPKSKKPQTPKFDHDKWKEELKEMGEKLAATRGNTVEILMIYQTRSRSTERRQYFLAPVKSGENNLPNPIKFPCPVSADHHRS